MSSFIEELKRRRVIRVATLYVVAFWPIVQIVDIASPTLGLGDDVMRYLVFAFLGGLPVALVLSWIFDINRDGIVRTGEGSDGDEVPALGHRNEMLLIGTLIVVIVGLFVFQAFLGGEEQPASAPVPAVASVTKPLSPDPTIAVLPFATFSSDLADEQFSDGLTEELLNALARVRGLRVAARTSSFAYKGVNRNVTEIAKELGVGTILEGSVRRNDVDNQVRVTAQLIDARTDEHYWSRDYTHEYKDIFRIQEEIARDVAQALQVTLLEEDQPQVTRRTSPEAMVMINAARDEMSRRTEESLQDAVRFFRKATELDPAHADAHAELAQVYLLLGGYGFDTWENVMPPAKASLEEAMALDSGSGIAWATKGLMERYESDNASARQSLEKAIELNPSYAMAFMWYAATLDTPGESLHWYQKALALDPRSPTAGYNVAQLLIEQGRDHEAMAIFESMVEADPYFAGSYELAGRINERRGRLDEAVAQYLRAWEFQPLERYAVKLAELHLNLMDDVAAAGWIDKAAAFETENMLNYIAWLRIQLAIVKEERQEANALLATKFELGSEDSIYKQVDAIYAAYYMNSMDDVVAAYHRAVATMPYEDWKPVAEFSGDFVLEVLLAASYALAMEGDTEEAEAVRTWVAAELENIKSGGFIPPSIYYIDTLLAAATGDRKTVLFSLQRAMDEGWHEHWRPSVEPALQGFQDDAAFTSMLGGLATRMELMREQLQFASSFDEGWGD